MKIFINNMLSNITNNNCITHFHTFFSSFVGGFFKHNKRGAYKKFNIAIPNSIHSKPIFLTSVPLIAGPENTTKKYMINEIWQKQEHYEQCRYYVYCTNDIYWRN